MNMKNIIKKVLREFQENYSEISIINSEDNDEVIDVLYTVFGNLGINKEQLYQKIKPRLNNGLSIKIKYNDNIVGVYLLNEKSINEFITQIELDQIGDFKKDDTEITLDENLSDNGLQGIALVVLPEYKQMGFGKKLKEYTYNLGYDYIWGVQDKRLENIDFWLNTRKIFAESSIRYATYLKL